MELRSDAVLASVEMSEVNSDGGASEGDADYESLPAHASLGTHMTAGAVAGVLEHTVMYPVDSVKVTQLNSTQLYTTQTHSLTCVRCAGRNHATQNSSVLLKQKLE